MWAWLKRWGGALFGAISALLLLVLGGGWLWRRQKSKLGRVQDQLAVEKATNKIHELRAVREEVERHAGEKDEAIAQIDAQIDAQREVIRDAHEHGADLSAAELADEFARSGL